MKTACSERPRLGGDERRADHRPAAQHPRRQPRAAPQRAHRASVDGEDGTFKSADELSDLYGSKGVTNGEPIIAYCRIGERSAHTWFVLHELLGKPDVKNYDGSWTEWGNMVNVPIEKS